MSNSVTDSEMCIFLCLFVFTVLTDAELIKNALQIGFNHYKQWKIRLKCQLLITDLEGQLW